MSGRGVPKGAGRHADPAMSIERILDEHAELRDVLEQFGEADDLAVVSGLLRRLRALLKLHFAHEEAPGGFLRVIAGDTGVHGEDVDRITVEHREILAAVEALARRLDDGERRPTLEVEADVAALLARLRAHDDRETELLDAVAGEGVPLAIDRAAGPETGSGALAVNLRRTAVDVVIPVDQAVLLEITAHLYGVQEATRKLLREINHPYVGWAQTLEDLHRRAMSDFDHHVVHERAAEAVGVFCRLYAMAVNAVRPALRETAMRYHLYYLERVATDAGSRLPIVLPALEPALESLQEVLDRDPEAAAVASPRLKALARTLNASPPDGAGEVGARALALYADALRHTYARWLAVGDPAAWWRALMGADAREPLPDAVAAISHARLAQGRRALEAMTAVPGGLGTSVNALFSLPDEGTIEQGYLVAASSLDPAADAGHAGALRYIRWHMRILTEPILSPIHEQALAEIGRRYVEVLRTADRQPLTQLVRETFATLRQGELTATAIAFNLIETIGREVLAAEDADWADLVIDEILTLDFPRPEFAGFTDEWGVRVNPAHLRAIRAFLALVEANPWGARRLLAALVVQLRIGGVFLLDTDLFQRDVSRLLACDLGPVRHQVNHLLRLLPVFFQDLGAEGELRDVSTRIDEIGGREDPLCNFLRKQCHVESNPRLVDFVEAIGCYWASGDPAVLEPYVPARLYARFSDGAARTPGVTRAFAALAGSEDPRTVFALEPATVAKRLDACADLRAIDREKVELLCALRRLIGHKYELVHDDLLERLRAFHRLPGEAVDALERALADDQPAVALDILLEMLERLEAIVADREPTEALEDIYHKRHIAAGIPSMYGRYREPRFDAVSLRLRVESLTRVLLERLVASCDPERADADNLRTVATCLRLTIRGLRADACRVGGPETHTAMLEEALAANDVTVDQYVDLFRCLAHDVEQILRTHIFDVYEPVLDLLVGAMIDRDQLAPEHGGDRQETVLKITERFLRDMIAQSFALPQVDRLVEQTLHALAKRQEPAAARTARAPVRLDDEAWCVRIDGEDGEPCGPLWLGSKGYLVRSMARAGLPVPPGFILTTRLFTAREAMRAAPAFERAVSDRIRAEVARLEQTSGQRFGDPSRPLLLSVRSGAAISMPGMLETFLNVGINADVAAGFAAAFGSPWAAWDAYRRFLQTWGMSYGIPRDRFDALIREAKLRFHAAKKSQLDAEHMRAVALRYRQLLLDHGVHVVDDPHRQLGHCIDLVLRSWHTERARLYRSRMAIADAWGTAVIVQSMVYGNLSARSGTGVALTCDPRRCGAEAVELYGDFVVQGQGDDVVGGLVETFPVGEHQRRTASSASPMSLERDFPAVHGALLRHARSLVVDHGLFDQEIEFTFEGDREEDLYILQTRDLVPSTTRVEPIFVPGEPLARAKVATGIGTGGGALSGRVALKADDVVALRRRFPDDPIILLRSYTVPDDVPLLLQADGMVTAVGGATSHAAVAARRLERTCVVGCRALEVDEAAGRSWLAGRPLQVGDELSIDGFDGSIYLGRHPSVQSRRRRPA